MVSFQGALAWTKQFFIFATAKGVPSRSLLIAIFVGTVLIAINQGALLIKGQFPPWWQLLLTYLVPYIVSTAGAVSAMFTAKKAALGGSKHHILWDDSSVRDGLLTHAQIVCGTMDDSSCEPTYHKVVDEGDSIGSSSSCIRVMDEEGGKEDDTTSPEKDKVVVRVE